MPLLINGQPSKDSWVFVSGQQIAEQGEALITASAREDQPTVYPLAYYLAHRALFTAQAAGLGLLVTGDDDLTALDNVLSEVSLIAIDFAVLRDGRGFSIARNIKRRGFKGEVRAVGDVSYDRLDNMQRSGFNAYQIADENYSADTINAFTEISVNYQSTHLR